MTIDDDKYLMLSEGSGTTVPALRRGWENDRFSSMQGSEPTLFDYLSLAKKRLPVILGGAGAGFLLAVTYCLLASEMYTAETTLEIRGYAPVLAGVQSETLFGNDTRKIEYSKTTVAKLELDGLADEVLTKDDLAKDLQSYLDSRKSFFDRSFGWIKRTVTGSSSGKSGGRTDEHYFHKPGIIKKYLELIDINPIHETNLVTISVTTSDPSFSQRLANAHATGFIEHLQQERQQSISANLSLLQRQSTDLKERVTKAEQALSEYADKNQLVTISESQGNSIIAQQIQGLAGLLAEATGKRVASEALFNEANEKAALESSVFDTDMTKELRNSLKQAEAEYATMGERVTPAFPAMVELRAKIDVLKRLIDGERKRIVKGMESKVQSDRATEEKLREQIEGEKSKAQALSRRLIQYDVLAKEAASLRDLYQAVLKQVKEIEISAASATSNVFVSDYASLPVSPSAPKKNIIIVLLTLLGLGAGCIVAFILEALDKTLKTSQEAQAALDLPILGVVPEYQTEEEDEINTMGGPLSISDSSPLAPDESNLPATARAKEIGIAAVDAPWDIVAEALRTIRASVLLSSADHPPKVIMVTSATKGEGKTTIASNLAATLAQASNRTLLIDCDLRASKMTSLFRGAIGGSPRGLSDLLTGHSGLQEAVHATGIAGLDILPAGSKAPNPAELLGSHSMGQLTRDLSNRYDFIVIDSPPVLAVSDALLLSRLVDSVLLVVRSRKTERTMAQEARRRLARVNARVLGIVLNAIDAKVANEYDLGVYESYVEPFKRQSMQ